MGTAHRGLQAVSAAVTKTTRKEESRASKSAGNAGSTGKDQTGTKNAASNKPGNSRTHTRRESDQMRKL